jgi:hypothetical protein
MIERKVVELKNNYNEWFFVVLNKDFVVDYKKLGKAVFSYINKQNTQKQDYVQLEKKKEA